jgi:hypothetical protein
VTLSIFKIFNLYIYMAEEKENGLTGKILAAILGPITTIAIVIVLACLLIASIIRVQKGKASGKEILPFLWGSNLSRAIKCVRPEDHATCMVGRMDEQRKRFGLSGYENRNQMIDFEYAAKANLSVTDAFLMKLFDVIGNVFFSGTVPSLEAIFNTEGQPPTLGTGNSILLVLKLAIIYGIFTILMPIMLLPLGIGGGIIGVYLQQGKSLWTIILAIILGIIGIPGTYILPFGLYRLFGIGGDAGVKFKNIFKNFMKHFGWLVVFIFVVIELSVVLSLFGGRGQSTESAASDISKSKVTPVVVGVVASAVALLYFMIKSPKLFKKVKN